MDKGVMAEDRTVLLKLSYGGKQTDCGRHRRMNIRGAHIKNLDGAAPLKVLPLTARRIL